MSKNNNFSSTYSTNNLKNVRLIYTIDTKLNVEEIEKIISECQIEFFSIDTTCFEKVKEYLEIIDVIKDLRLKYQKNIGIIAELKGRKLQVESINFKNMTESKGIYNLKKGEKIKLLNQVSTPQKLRKLNDNAITVKFKYLHKMLKKGDTIIINDNQGSLNVLSVNEIVSNSQSMMNLHAHESAKKVEEGIPLHSKVDSCFDPDPHFPDPDSLPTTDHDDKEVETLYDDFYNMGCKDENYKITRRDTRSKFFHQASIQYCKKILPDNHHRERDERRKSLIATLESKTYEVLTEVNYDCCISKNSLFFIPNVDYLSLDINVLSPREIAEINELDNRGVDFICISIKNLFDIESIRQVNSNIKIIASLPDYMALDKIHDILNYASGIVLSRTFQILNGKKMSSINQLTNHLIDVCKENGKPIFSYLDIYSKNHKKVLGHVITDILSNISIGMDGFFINLKKNTSQMRYDIKEVINSVNYITNYFHEIPTNSIVRKSLLQSDTRIYSNDNYHKYGVLMFLIKKYDLLLTNCATIYIGNKICDLEEISKLWLRSPILVFSTDEIFLRHANLFYSVIGIYNENLTNLNEINKEKLYLYLQDKFSLFKPDNFIMVIDDEKTRKFAVKLISD